MACHAPDGFPFLGESGEVVISGKTVEQLRSEFGMSANYIPAGSCTALQYILYDNYTSTSAVTSRAFAVIAGYTPDYHTGVDHCHQNLSSGDE